MTVPDIEYLYFDQALLPGGWEKGVRIGVCNGRMASVEAGAVPQADDECHACAIPGMSNLHSHAFQRAMAGLTEIRGPSDDSFWTWRDVMYRFVDTLTPDDAQTIAALAYAEMLENGFTRVGEFHYVHHDATGAHYTNPAEMSAAILEAAARTGIGMTLLPVYYAHSDFGEVPPQAGQRRFINDLDSFAVLVDEARKVAVSALPDAVIGIAPHSLRGVGQRELQALTDMAPGAPVHIHVAEQRREVEACLTWSGQRPVEWLFNHADVNDRWCLVHATHITDAEMQNIAKSGAVAGLCPITEANLGDGIFPATAFIEAGGRYGVGSDSNVRIDMTEELRLLEYGQRLSLQGRNLMAQHKGQSTGMALYTGAMAGGAKALGAEGGLAEGLAADIVGLDLRHPSLVGRTGGAIADALIFSAGNRAIDCVWRYGKKVVSGGVHVDRASISRCYADMLEKILT